ncbi:hypothetical protein OH76DRAFT_562369 [Lentinus brumalis]|uniref:Uncharacterized protein n=1 Tax=Lentinus brumalis TaxID=2498619 RepID=A0A371D9I6_9APHY|nr:hypothetical protein OH76DRAFT_562369 [Polyporus brumalis]
MWSSLVPRAGQGRPAKSLSALTLSSTSCHPPSSSRFCSELPTARLNCKGSQSTFTTPVCGSYNSVRGIATSGSLTYLSTMFAASGTLYGCTHRPASSGNTLATDIPTIFSHLRPRRRHL